MNTDRQDGAARRDGDLVAVDLALRCIRRAAVDQQARRQLRRRNAKADLVRGRIEIEAEDRNRAITVSRGAPQQEDGFLRVIPGLVRDELAVGVEPLNIENARRGLVLAMQEV